LKNNSLFEICSVLYKNINNFTFLEFNTLANEFNLINSI
jgi:hypothetical protein